MISRRIMYGAGGYELVFVTRYTRRGVWTTEIYW